MNEDDDKFVGECPDLNYKLILIGNSRAGKTSIINKFVNDSFNEKEQ
jgi:GTPase SAR1 family protein